MKRGTAKAPDTNGRGTAFDSRQGTTACSSLRGTRENGARKARSRTIAGRTASVLPLGIGALSAAFVGFVGVVSGCESDEAANDGGTTSSTPHVDAGHIDGGRDANSSVDATAVDSGDARVSPVEDA